MSNLWINFSSGIVKRSKIIIIIISGILVTGLVGLSGYLLYSNTQLKEAQLQSELAAKETIGDASSASSTPEAALKVGTMSAVKQTVTASTKTASSDSAVAAPVTSWNAFLDEIVVLEGDFFSDYSTVDLAPVNQAEVVFQQKTSVEARVSLETILRKTAQAQLLFPNKSACLNKEKAAFEKYRVVLDHSDTLLAYTSETTKTAGSMEDFLNKQGTVALRIANSDDLNEIAQLLLESQPILKEIKTHLQKANSIISLSGVTEYIAWVDATSVFYQKYSELFATGNYSNAETDEELVVLQEIGVEAGVKWGAQLEDWVVANITIPIAEAEKVYTQSENLCEWD